MINVIAAITKNRGLGLGNKLLIHNSEDLKEFKRLTSDPNSVIVCGRKTYESLPKIVQDRVKYVLSTNPSKEKEVTLNDLKKSILFCDDVWVLGGGEIYKKFIEENLADRIYLTIFDENLDADTFFPEIPEDKYACKIITYFKTFKRKVYELKK